MRECGVVCDVVMWCRRRLCGFVLSYVGLCGGVCECVVLYASCFLFVMCCRFFLCV